jgi:hypothetical protein
MSPRDDEYAGVGFASKLGRGNLARVIAYVAVLGMVVPIVIGAVALMR